MLECRCQTLFDMRIFCGAALAGSERYETVEVLRGLAALSVLWFHLTNGNPSFLPNNSLLKSSGAYGYLGADLFFVISGFIIPYSLSVRNYSIHSDGLSFLLRRIVRIEPAYLVSAALMVVGQAASALTPGSNAAMPTSGVIASLALHVVYVAPWLDVPWLSPVYWSLAIEFQYYLAMLFFAPMLLSKRRASIYPFLIATAVLALAIHDRRALFPFLPLFGLGFVRFLALRRVMTWVELSSWAVVFFVLCWLTLGPHEAVTAALAFGFLLLPLDRPVPILSFLGGISYSLYLVHVPVGGRIINLSTRLQSTTPVQLAAVASAVAASILAAYCFWRVIEKPSARLSKLLGPKRDTNALYTDPLRRPSQCLSASRARSEAG